MQAKPRSKPSKSYSADTLMLNTASCIVRDFQANLNDPCLSSALHSLIRAGDVKGMREIGTAVTEDLSIAEFKAIYQIESLTKRYRFQKDLYSDQELQDRAVKSFLDTQDRLAAVDLDSLPADTQRVLDCAAFYIAKVLGEYSDEEHRTLCRFGRKASVGVPAREACLAARWQLPLTGSREQIDWFDSEMSQVESVQEYWAAQKGSDPNGSTYQEISSLTLTLVPKSYKSLRSIMPNTTVGSYMSHGLGEMMRKRLKRKGYDIATLQERHKWLAQMASRTNLYATADLSSASDSITDALVRRLLPPDWYRILTASRIGKVTLPNGTQVQSLTFCTMGIGYTFPLQTLVFLALLKAIEATLFNRLDRRCISVYGDDMIYHVRMHDHVIQHFGRIGFVINLDKTFHDSGFRESCGGDYYRGVDVRPFQPQNGPANVSQKAYEAMLYKFINGLLMRWSEHEIGLTLAYLTAELEATTGKCKLVPADFPADSGIKCPTLTYWNFLQYARVAKPKHIGHGVYRFSYLRLVSETRKENRHEPYIWEALRGLDRASLMGCCTNADGKSSQVEGVRRSPLNRRLDALLGTDGYTPQLLTIEDNPIQTFRSKLTGCRLRRSSTHVTVSHTGRYARRSGTSCFEDRR